jgi:hypothetical protein
MMLLSIEVATGNHNIRDPRLWKAKDTRTTKPNMAMISSGRWYFGRVIAVCSPCAKMKCPGPLRISTPRSVANDLLLVRSVWYAPAHCAGFRTCVPHRWAGTNA